MASSPTNAAASDKPNKDALAFIDFVNASPTPFHAVAVGARKLEAAGFVKISERDSWAELKPGGKYYFTRNASSLLAFHLPKGYTSASPLALIATHVDSCALKVRPVSKNAREGWERLAVETYGGGIWRTWWDRDLGVAGRVVCHKGDGQWENKLVKIDKAVARIPSLAIHLDRTSNDAFTFNKETQLYPLLGLSSLLNAPVPAAGLSTTGVSDAMGGKHHPALLSLVANDLGVAVEDIADFELQLYDLQPAAIGGLADELILAPRVDNLLSSFSALEGLVAASSSTAAAADASGEPTAQAILLFDNEEVGSISHQGAESSMLPNLAARLAAAGIGREKGAAEVRPEEVLARSFLISADMGHGVHPNYPEKHHDLHKPMLGGGVVIKTNANQRYTSNAPTTFVLRRIAHLANVPVQEFEVRNDSSCGSTVGPGLSTVVRTVDIGLAQLSMHSIRETAGVADVPYYIQFMRTFLAKFGEVDKALTID